MNNNSNVVVVDVAVFVVFVVVVVVVGAGGDADGGECGSVSHIVVVGNCESRKRCVGWDSVGCGY